MTSHIRYQHYEYDDFVFENRNTRFGAYELRGTYYKRLFIPMLLIFFGFTGFILSLHYTNTTPEKQTPALNPRIEDGDYLFSVNPPVKSSEPRKSPASSKSTEYVIGETKDTAAVRDTKQHTPTSSINSNGEGTNNGNENGNTKSGNEKGKTETVNPDTVSLIPEDRDPEFIGGTQAINAFIARNLKYPEDAERKGIQGIVYISFIVEEDGSISNIEVLRGLVVSACNDEAVRVISKMPKWKPAIILGKPGRSRMKIPIRYELAED